MRGWVTGNEDENDKKHIESEEYEDIERTTEREKGERNREKTTDKSWKNGEGTLDIITKKKKINSGRRSQGINTEK